MVSTGLNSTGFRAWARELPRSLRVYAGFAVLLVFIPLGYGASAEPDEGVLAATFKNTIHPFLDNYCGRCHVKDKPKGDFDMRPFTSFGSVLGHERHWKMILDQLKEQQMPPEESQRQPTAGERATVVDWIKSVRRFAGNRNAGDPGIVLARRLSSAEYDNTIRDLTGVDIKPASEFPVDPANEAGFDNSGESLMMSPSLLKKYLEAARKVAEHLVLKPDGLAFAPFPMIADTDRDKYNVRRIIEFYQRQRTNYADYFFAAWRYAHRAAFEEPNATLPQIAASAGLSPKYLATISSTVSGRQEEAGPVAALQALWRSLPAEVAKTNEVRKQCEEIARFVGRLREKVKVNVPTLHVQGMNAGSQPLVLWKDREMAAKRRTYGGGGLDLAPEDLGLAADSPASAMFFLPADDLARAEYEAAFRRFCSVFPDAFYVSERGRIFLDGKEDPENTGRLLSAGFHNQMGYFRDDQPLCEMILDEAGRAELDRLWEEFDFVSDVPNRMHSGHIWFERAESRFLRDPQFDFARAEDKDSISEEKFSKLADLYLKKVRTLTTNETVIHAVEEYHEISEANIRRVEKQRVAAEPAHLAALQDLAARAYRRPLAAAERTELERFYQRLRQEDEATHEEAVRDTLASILMSPYFCYRADLPNLVAGTDSKTVEPLSDYALASRLSYFLWASMPDAELLARAEAGELHRKEVLQAQVRRMLGDARVRGLATEFGGNWLDFRRFEEHNAVDRDRFPMFDNELRRSMFEEPIRLFLDIVQSDRSVLDFLFADYTFVNPALARHYGVPEPVGGSNAWMRVEAAAQFKRGGLLPMAVFQTRNSPGLRTSPVKRGYWVVRRLLGEEIPPPPPKVPELPADEAKLGALTLREVLAKHREDKSCAACHARFDSYGLVFEGYGPIGEARTKDLAGKPVDTRAPFPGGLEASGVEGLREYLSSHRQDDFVDNLCRKLLVYALGRTLLLSDEPTIEEMRSRVAAQGYRFGTLVEAIVTSPQFLNKRTSAKLTQN